MKQVVKIMIILLFIFILLSIYKFYKYIQPPLPEDYKLFYKNTVNSIKNKNKLLLEIPNKKPVPKKVYRICCSKEPLKHCGGRNRSHTPIEITQKNLPEWEQIIYGDKEVEEFLYNYFGQNNRITKAYFLLNKKLGAARADLIRYLLIYIFGGLYIDMKSCVSGPLPPIPDDKDMVVSYWKVFKPQSHLFPKTGEFQNWYIYARPKSPILRDIIEHVVQNIYDLYEYPYKVLNTLALCVGDTDSKNIVLCTTGPIALTIAINNSKYKDTVLISSTINNSLKYMCQENSITSAHYSQQNEPLVFPKIHALYIPNTVYFTYYDLNIIPEYVYKNINKYCDGYNIQIYDDKMCQDFINEYFGNYALNIFNSFEFGAHKADFWRYCILYIKGGLYFDIKTDFQVPIRDVFDLTIPNTWYTVIANDKISIYNGIIVTPPRNPVIRECIDYIYKKSKPKYYNEYVKKLFKIIQNKCTKPLSIGNNFQNNNWTCILQEEYCVKCNKDVKNCDRYEYQCIIKDKNDKINFKTRYNDFPWK